MGILKRYILYIWSTFISYIPSDIYLIHEIVICTLQVKQIARHIHQDV